MTVCTNSIMSEFTYAHRVLIFRKERKTVRQTERAHKLETMARDSLREVRYLKGVRDREPALDLTSIDSRAHINRSN
jgi:hypothetical protein